MHLVHVGVLHWQGNQLACLTGHSDHVTTVACASDVHKTICTGALDHTVKLWQPELEPDRGIPMAMIGSHEAEITCVASSVEGKLILSSSRYVWLLLLFCVELAALCTVCSDSLSWFPAVANCRDGCVKLWQYVDTEDVKRLQTACSFMVRCIGTWNQNSKPPFEQRRALTLACFALTGSQ